MSAIGPSSSQSTLNDEHRNNPQHDAEKGVAPLDNNPPDTTPDESSREAKDEPTSEKLYKPLSAASAGPPPNGGLQAWIQVLCAFMIFFNTWGLLNTFGVFQTYYETGALFTQTSSNISWIGSIQAYLVVVSGIYAGPLYDRGYLKILILVGSFGIVFGHMMLSLAHEYWQVILAQGFCVGIGGGLIFVPCLAVLPTYFTNKLGLAVGLAASGSSFGGIIYPIVFYRLVAQIGFGWSVRILGFIALATLLIPLFLMKQRVKPPKPRDFIDWAAFSDIPFMTFTVGTAIGFIGLYVMLFYISFYGQEQGITDANLSFYLVPIFNASSMFGRTLPNALSDKTGPINLVIPGALIVGILTFCMMAVKSVAGIIIVALLFGFFSGIFIALPPVCFVALTKDKSKIGTRIGMGFAMIGFGILVGGPGAGGVLGQNEPLNWTGLWVFGGVVEVAAAAIFLALRLGKSRTLMVKV